MIKLALEDLYRKHKCQTGLWRLSDTVPTMQLTDREFWLLLLGIAYGVKFSEAFDRSGADQVIENVAHKVPDVADQARQFAELAMDLPHEMSPTMGDLLAVSPASEGEIACLTPDVADPEPA